MFAKSSSSLFTLTTHKAESNLGQVEFCSESPLVSEDLHSSTQSTPSPNLFNEKKCTQEEAFRQFFFGYNTPLLHAYCEGLLTITPNPHHILVLLQYYSSRGSLVDLLTTLAVKEIETADSVNKLFVEESPFLHVYSFYLSHCCNDYLQFIVHFLNGHISKNSVDKSIDNVDAQSMDYCNDVSLAFNQLFVDSNKGFNQFPIHLRVILRSIYRKVCEKRSESEANEALATLLFTKYLFAPFFKNSALLQTLKNTVSAMFASRAFIYYEGVHSQYSPFINLLSFIKIGPTSFGRSKRGINSRLQERSLKDIVEIVKWEMKKISPYYDGDFYDVFCYVKGHKKDTFLQNVDYVTILFMNWSDDREEMIKSENYQLKKSIAALKERNESIKQKIASLC
ncbi:Ras-GAP domain-containing protein [Entamoeba marina]